MYVRGTLNVRSSHSTRCIFVLQSLVIPHRCLVGGFLLEETPGLGALDDGLVARR